MAPRTKQETNQDTPMVTLKLGYTTFVLPYEAGRLLFDAIASGTVYEYNEQGWGSDREQWVEPTDHDSIKLGMIPRETMALMKIVGANKMAEKEAKRQAEREAKAQQN